MSAAASVMTDQMRMLLEFRSDFEYYAPHALKIRTKDGKVVPFRLNRAQTYVHRRLETQRRDHGRVRALVLKGRQQGMSTYIEGRFYWLTSGTPGVRAFIVTHEDAATANLFEMAARYHEHCPAFLKPRTGRSNAKELIFDRLDSGYKVATAGTKNVGRSSTIQYMHGSEVAFWPHAKDHLAGLGQTIPDANGTEVILESTANGPTGEFYSLWNDATCGRNDYIALFVPWYWQEEYRRADAVATLELTAEDKDYQETFGLDDAQMAWRHAKIRGDFRGDVSLFDQEYPATPAMAFLHIDGQTLIKATHVVRACARRDLEARGARIIGVDPAEYGDDDTAIIFRQGRVASDLLRVHGKSPMEIVGIVARMADRLGDIDAINVDSTGLGAGIVDRLIELGYPANRIMVGESAIDDVQYARRGDEIWGEMRDWLGDLCQIPDDEVLRGDLIARTYSYDSSRCIKLTPKEKLKAESKKSPDAGDALSLTFATRFNPNFKGKKLNHQRRSRGKVL